MNKKSIFLSLFIILMIGLQVNYSQTKQTFTTDSLISELKVFYKLNEIDLEKDTIAYKKDSLISVLGNLWSSSIKKEDKITITRIANKSVAKRFNKDITIWEYLQTVIFLNNKSNFAPWLAMLDNMINSSLITSGETENFITNIYKLNEYNFLIKTNTSRWKLAENTAYKYVFDKSEKTFNITIPTTELEAYSVDNDTITIQNASGDFDIIKSIWKGKYGKITWEKYGIPSSEVNVKLRNYIINMRKTEFEIDSVTYVNKNILKHDILGKITHIASLRGYKEGLFPKFRSYKNNFTIKGKQEKITFISGVEMRGKTLKFVGTSSTPAIAQYIDKGKTLIKAKSEDFISLEEVLKSNQAQITLFIAENDSITHPNVSFTIKENDFSFTRNPEGTGKRPFFNSLQKTYITVDNISWNTEDSLIRFYSKLGNEAQFKSFDYFTKADFTKHKMYEQRNPLFDIKKYTRHIKSREFYANDYAKFVKQPQTGTVHRLMGLWYEGFIDYNPETKHVIVRQKLFDYIKYFFEKKDYDVINIISKGKTRKGDAVLFPLSNATFDIKSNQMALYGVDNVVLNERKKIGFVPHRGMLILGQNRNMMFSGRLRVGLADFYGNGFAFNYENYDINFTKADSLIYRVWDEEITEEGKVKKAKYLTSTIEQVTGKIRIDVKTNKSGAKDIPEFPKFTCLDTSYVYYERSKDGSAYPRETFYFVNYPFMHDSLLYMTKDRLAIPGEMIAGGIVPNFEDTLEVQNDYSLGFLHHTPEGGLPLFNGKGTLSSKNSELQSYIKLSNNGLEANGVAKWNNTTIATKEFNLYPDSLTTLADEIEISEFINPENFSEFPTVKGKLVSTRWDAKKDVVRYKTTGIAAEMYDEKVQFSGEFEYRPNSLTGEGRAVVNEGTIHAKEFAFSKKTFLSDKADIDIKEENSNNKDVIIKNMKTFVDTKANKAVFAKIEEEDSYVNFVTDEYMTYPSHLVWQTGEGKINMNYNMNKFTNPKFSKQKVLLDSSYLVGYCGFDKTIFMPAYGDLKFVSTNKDQDSLMFFGSRANYNTSNKKIVTKDVMRIIVADIVVTPSSDVVIDENGEMEKLLKTTVKARGVHNISDVDIKINSSKKYVASSGIYQYEDLNKKLQNINFDNITYDVDKGASVAHGFVEQYEEFSLNPWFDYYGDVYFNASKDRLNFEGFAKLVHTCPSVPSWFYFKSEINPDSIYLPLSPDLHADIASNKARVFADIMTSRDTSFTFPAFLSNDKFGTSQSILSLRDSSYYVTYDDKKNRYEITTLEKFNDRTLPGNYLDIGRANCLVHGEGKMTLTESLKINDFGGNGEITIDTNADKITMNTLTYLDFFFSKAALNIIADKIALNARLSAVDIQSTTYKKQMYELLGVEQTDKMLSEMSVNLGKPKKFPEDLNKTMVFSNLFFKWDAESQSYKSMGKIGISNIGNKMINRYVDGYIQVRKMKTGDKVNIYLEIDKDEWFFFAFSGGIMRTFSSVSEYNTLIADLKTKYKKQKTNKGTFNYMLTNLETRNLFIFKFTGIHPAIDNFDDSNKDAND